MATWQLSVLSSHSRNSQLHPLYCIVLRGLRNEANGRGSPHSDNWRPHILSEWEAQAAAASVRPVPYP
jgi:hypothetical protein